MSLATIETRHPVTVALAYAIENGLVTPDREQSLRQELQDMVVEAAEKFVGFKNVESVRKALDITLGILSLAVVSSTEGRTEPQNWARLITTRGMKAIIGNVIADIKAASDVTSFAEIIPVPEEVPQDAARRMLLELATDRDAQRGGIWVGYETMRHRLAVKENRRITTELGLWLIRELVRQPLVVWIKRNEEEVGDRAMRLPHAEKVINNLLFRHCAGLPVKGKCGLTVVHFTAVNEAFKQDRAGWKDAARDRYEKLKGEIPKELHSALTYMGKDWYDRFLAKGPPGTPRSDHDLLHPNSRYAEYHTEVFL